MVFPSQTDDRPPLPPLLARAAEALRVLPTDNPQWGCDALLIVAGALNEAAAHLEIHHACAAADGTRAVQRQCHALRDRAQALAPIFAPAGDSGE